MDETKTPRASAAQISHMRRMLEKTTQIAEHASVSGSFKNGAGFAVQQYNSWLRSLEEMEAVPVGFFVTLPEDSCFDTVGVACAILASYLQGSEEPAAPSQHRYLIENHHHAQFSPEELVQLRELLIRRGES